MKRFITVADRDIALDADGYLERLADWCETVAEALAAEEGIELTDAHWEIIYVLRHFYQSYALAPAMRPLCKYVSQQLGAEKGRSIYLLTLFPESPAKLAAKIAGLPRPANCF